MPEAIVTRILRLAGYAAYAYELEEATSRLTLWVRQMAAEPYYACGGCGISSRDVHSWRERRVRDLPWAPGRCGWSSRCIACAVRGAGAHRAAAVRHGQGTLHDARGGGDRA
jgi:hypothetical protein